jgi:hypothetical protein
MGVGSAFISRPGTTLQQENSFDAEDAEERRDAENYIQKEISSLNAPRFLLGLPLGTLLVASRAAVPNKEHGSWRAGASRCAVLGVSAPLRPLR